MKPGNDENDFLVPDAVDGNNSVENVPGLFASLVASAFQLLL